MMGVWWLAALLACGTEWTLEDLDGDGYTWLAGDCDDEDYDVHPAADELCDGIDNDCDGEPDEDDAVDALTWFMDADEDGYGVDTNTTEACEQPEEHAAEGGDCDDTDPDINPGAAERTDDAVDSDCDGDNNT